MSRQILTSVLAVVSAWSHPRDHHGAGNLVEAAAEEEEVWKRKAVVEQGGEIEVEIEVEIEAGLGTEYRQCLLSLNSSSFQRLGKFDREFRRVGAVYTQASIV